MLQHLKIHYGAWGRIKFFFGFHAFKLTAAVYLST